MSSIRSSRDRSAEVAFLLTAFTAAYVVCELRFLLSDPFSSPEFFAGVAHHAGPKPWQYRILIPYTADILSQLRLPLLHSLERWSKLAELASLFLLVIAFRRYISLFIRDTAVASIVSFLILIILPFNFFFPRPHYPNYWYDTPSMLFFTLGLIFMVRKKWLPYYAVFAIATFNRETTCFLTIIYLLTSLGREDAKKIASHCVSQFVVWLAIKSLLVKLYVDNPGPTFEWYAQPGVTHFFDNIEFFKHPGNYPMFLSNMGFTWVVVLLHLRRIRVDFVKRSLLAVFPFFAGMMFVANIYELRVFGELIPVVLMAFILVFYELLQRPKEVAAGHAEAEGGRWVVTCSCGWTIRLPAHKMAEEAATLHQQEAREPARHTVSPGATQPGPPGPAQPGPPGAAQSGPPGATQPGPPGPAQSGPPGPA